MKRYAALLKDMESAGYLEEDPEGEWVRYEDAANAIAQLAAVQFRPIAERLIDAAIEKVGPIIGKDRAVVEASALVTEQSLRRVIAHDSSGFVVDWARAELARRNRCTCGDTFVAVTGAHSVDCPVVKP